MNAIIYSNPNERFLSNEEIKSKVPSIYGYPAETMSEKYIFTPTHEIIDSFQKVGWYPTKISGVKPSKRDINTVKHLIRFANTNENGFKLKGLSPEVIIINSHNGHCPLSAHLGFYRFACANGLISGTEISKMRWKHKKLDFAEVKQFILTATEEFNKNVKFITDYQKIDLTSKQRIQFAEKTIDMVWNGEMFEPELLLNARRDYDRENTLWNVFNRIQENVMKGGIRYNVPESRKIRNKFRTSHQIKNIDKEVNVNILLWGMMHKFYQEGKF